MNEPRSRFFEPEFEPRVSEGWRARWFDIVFHHESKPARNFDVLLIVAPISDRVGRRKVMRPVLLLSVVATVYCACCSSAVSAAITSSSSPSMMRSIL